MIVVYGGAIVVYDDAIAVNESAAVCIYWSAVNILKRDALSKIAVFFMKMLLLNWNQRLTFNDTRKKIWIRGVVYEIAVAITNPLKTITGLLTKMKMLKIDLKKVPSQKKKILHDYVGTMTQLFMKKKISLHNPFKSFHARPRSAVIGLILACLYSIVLSRYSRTRLLAAALMAVFRDWGMSAFTVSSSSTLVINI